MVCIKLVNPSIGRPGLSEQLWGAPIIFSSRVKPNNKWIVSSLRCPFKVPSRTWHKIIFPRKIRTGLTWVHVLSFSSPALRATNWLWLLLQMWNYYKFVVVWDNIITMFSPRVRLQHLFNKAVSFNLEHIALISMFHNFHLSITCTTLFPWIHIYTRAVVFRLFQKTVILPPIPVGFRLTYTQLWDIFFIRYVSICLN